jgi:hypothetical protein
MTAAVATASTIAALLASIAPAVGATAEVSAVRALTRIANTFAIAGVARAADVPAATHSTIASSGATTYSAPAADSAACVATGIAPSGRAAAVTTTSCVPACAPAGTTLVAAGETAACRAAARLTA